MSISTVTNMDSHGAGTIIYAVPDAIDNFYNNGSTLLFVNNGAATPTVITVNSLALCNQGVDHNITVTVPAGEQWVIGPFDVKRFNGLGGSVQVLFSVNLLVTCGAINLVN